MKVLNYSAVTDGHKKSSPAGSGRGREETFAFQHSSSLKCQFCLYLALNKQDKQFVQPKLQIICILFSLVLQVPLVECQINKQQDILLSCGSPLNTWGDIMLELFSTVCFSNNCSVNLLCLLILPLSLSLSILSFISVPLF